MHVPVENFTDDAGRGHQHTTLKPELSIAARSTHSYTAKTRLDKARMVGLLHPLPQAPLSLPANTVTFSVYSLCAVCRLTSIFRIIYDFGVNVKGIPEEEHQRTVFCTSNLTLASSYCNRSIAICVAAWKSGKVLNSTLDLPIVSFS